MGTERSNPVVIEAPGLTLHNVITSQKVKTEVAKRLLFVEKNADGLIKKFKDERFISKSKIILHDNKKKYGNVCKITSASASTASLKEVEIIASAQETLRY